jgi:hypothetical protein
MFQRFQGAHLKLNLEKWQLFQKEVWYLEHVVSPEGVTADPEKLEGVQCGQLLRKLRSFLGLCIYYRRFIIDLWRLTQVM